MSDDEEYLSAEEGEDECSVSASNASGSVRQRRKSSIKTPSPPKANSSPSTDPPAIAISASEALTADDEKVTVAPVPVVPPSPATAANSATAAGADAADVPPRPPVAAGTGKEDASKPEPLSAPTAAATDASPADEPAVVVMATPEVEPAETAADTAANTAAETAAEPDVDAASAPVPGRSPMAEALIRVLSSQEHRAKGVVDPSVLEGAAQESSLPAASSSPSYASASFSPGGGPSPVKGGAGGAGAGAAGGEGASGASDGGGGAAAPPPQDQEPMHALMEGDDTSSGEEDGEEGEWGGIASSGGSSGAPSSAGAAGANSSGASAVSAVASGGKRTGTGKDEVLPADFDHELVFKMTNRETGEAYDLRTGQPWRAGLQTNGDDPSSSSAAAPDMFRLRGLIPTRELLLATAGRQDRDDDGNGGESGGGGGGSGRSSPTSSSSVGGGDGGSSEKGGSKKGKGNLFARAAHKVHKRSVAAATKLSTATASSGGEARGEAGSASGISGCGLPMQHVAPGHEQTGDHVKVKVSGKDFSEWSSLYMVQGLAAHEGPIWCLAWSPSGMYLASAGQDAVVNVWKAIESPDEVPPAWRRDNHNSSNSSSGNNNNHNHNNNSSSPLSGDSENGSPNVVPGFGARNSSRRWNCPIVIEDYAVRPDGAQAAHAATTGMHHHHSSSSKQQSAAMDRGAYDAVLHVATPFRTWREHTMDIVDLSWNANDFLLSASIDRTVRLWHVSTNECLHCFPHADFVTSVDFHPKNDLLFLSGCFDKRLRVWSIPESHVAAWATTPEMITSVCFSPTGNQALAGLFNGQVFFWHTDSQGLEVQHVSTLAGGGGGMGGSSSASFDASGGFDAGVAPGSSSGGGGSGSRGMPATAGSSGGGSSSSSSLATSGGGGGFGHLPPLAAAAHVQLRYYTQVEARNRRGKFQHGRKVTGLAWLPAAALRHQQTRGTFEKAREAEASATASGGAHAALPISKPSLNAPGSLPQQLLVSTNDSRVRLFQMETFSQLCKFKGLVNENMQVRASFSADGKYVVCGSENGYVHIWNTSNLRADALDGVGEHGVAVRGAGRLGQGWRGRFGGLKQDRNLMHESFRATHATKGSSGGHSSSSGGGGSGNSSDSGQRDSSSGRSGGGSESSGDGSLGGGGGGSQPRSGTEASGGGSSSRRPSGSQSAGRSSGSGGHGRGAPSTPAIATAAVFAPFATVSLAAAASEVHMLYTDLEQLANSVIVVADYGGNLRFYMRASAEESEHQGDMF